MSQAHQVYTKLIQHTNLVRRLCFPLIFVAGFMQNWVAASVLLVGFGIMCHIMKLEILLEAAFERNPKFWKMNNPKFWEPEDSEEYLNNFEISRRTNKDKV